MYTDNALKKGAAPAAEQPPRPSAALRFLYGTCAGRLLLKPLTAPALSRLAGRFMDSRLSRGLISGFIRKNGIDPSEYESCEYESFNAFFTRRIRPECRPVDAQPQALISPCDARLSAYRIGADSRFTIKGGSYSSAELLGGDEIAARFDGGDCLVFRLSVDDYHRYIFFDDGVLSGRRFLPGRLHTVRPVAQASVPVFKQNAREYSLLNTRHFGLAAQIEVGAMLVGRIENHPVPDGFARGQEKGFFLYGGSTIVLLLTRGAAALEPAIFENTERGLETRVRCGARIGLAAAAAKGGTDAG